MVPDHAKSCIVVLGNLKACLCEKSEKYAPVLQYSSQRLLTSMVTENCCVLKQDKYRNVFYSACFPQDKTTIIIRPPGDPDAKKDVF